MSSPWANVHSTTLRASNKLDHLLNNPMDPLSISASVIAIATLAAQNCSALSDLRSICQNLPGRLHAVNNEVADLNFVLLQISLLFNDRACLPGSKMFAIPHFLKQADKKTDWDQGDYPSVDRCLSHFTDCRFPSTCVAERTKQIADPPGGYSNHKG